MLTRRCLVAIAASVAFGDGDGKGISRYGPKFSPLPHPSWRSESGCKEKSWFEQEVIPQLRRAVRRVVKD